MWDFLDKSWVQIKIAFDVRDGLRKTGKAFELPADIQILSNEKKQLTTLCNLYANHGQSIEELAVYFALDRTQVISVLMQEGLLEDQRLHTGRRIKGGRRESDRSILDTARSENVQGEPAFNKTTQSIEGVCWRMVVRHPRVHAINGLNELQTRCLHPQATIRDFL